MEVESYEHGVPSWVDLGTPDPAAAAAFYSALFGWNVQQGPPEADGYAIAELRGRPVAGIGPQQNPGPPVWSTYVNVDDADAVVGKVAGAGGMAFMAPMDVMDVGRMAFFADPLGAVIGVWQPKAHKGAGIVNEPGTLTWNELVTTATDATAARVGELGGSIMMAPRDIEPGRFSIAVDPTGAMFSVITMKS